MEQTFTIAEWTVDPASNEVASPDGRVRLEPRVMDLLVYLAESQGEVLSRQQIFRDVWHDADVGESALLTAISTLRRQLKDDPRQPRIIETIPKRGYRLIAPTNARSAALAVLPLRDMSLSADQPYLADGISELLMNDLGRAPGLRVISWPSVATFRDSELSVREIAEKLGARYVVDGTVLHTGNGVRVSIRLNDTSEISLVWAESYEVQLEELLNMQRTLAGKIAGAISGRLIRQPPPPPEATSERSAATVAYLRGRFHWYKLTPEHLDRALEYFEESIALDPSFGPAYAGIADVWGARGYWGLLPMQFVRQKVWEPLRKAGPVCEQWSETQSLLGTAHFLFEKNWVAAESHLRRAIWLNPNLAHTHLVYGLFAITLRRADAIEWIDKAARLDPLNPSVQLTRALLAMSQNQEEKALQYVERVLELDPDHPPANQVRANLAWYLGESDAPEYEAGLWADDAEIRALLEGDQHRRVGRDVLLRIGKLLRSRAAKSYIQPMKVARAFSLGGDLETALDILEEASESGDLMPIPFLQADCTWHSLRETPRFKAIVAEIGIPD